MLTYVAVVSNLNLVVDLGAMSNFSRTVRATINGTANADLYIVANFDPAKLCRAHVPSFDLAIAEAKCTEDG